MQGTPVAHKPHGHRSRRRNPPSSNPRIVSAAHKAFVADISHRLRTPLTGICLNADLLKEKRLETEAERDNAIADIADNSARLTGLVEQLLDHVAKS